MCEICFKIHTVLISSINFLIFGGIYMDNNKRPENMVRITTKALADAFIAEQVAAVQQQVGDKKVLLALSGGVDSSVVAALLIKAILRV